MRKIRNNISATKDKGEKHIYLGWQFTFEPRKLFEMSDVSAQTPRDTTCKCVSVKKQ